jgi:hypothetical protein
MTLKGRITKVWSICGNSGDSDKIDVCRTGDKYDSCREDTSKKSREESRQAR